MWRLIVSGLIVLLVLIVLAQGAVLATFFLGPRSALDEPSDALLLISDLGVNLLIPDQDKTRPNPQANNPDAVQNIAQVYQSRCQVCHGVDGKGETTIGSAMFPRVSNLTGVRSQSRTDGALFWIIGNGLPHTGMPGWKQVLQEDQIWQLVLYVRALAEGIPTVSPPAAPTIAVINPTVSPTLVASNPTASPAIESSPTLPSTPAATSPAGSPTLGTTTPTTLPTFPPASPTISLAPTTATSPIRATDTITVVIQYYTYFDDSLSNVSTVPVGTRVVWIAADSDAHTVSSIEAPRTLNSPNLLIGETYEFTFTEPGEYEYFCVPHPDMVGTIIVK